MNESVREISWDIKAHSYILYWNEQKTEFLTPNSILLSFFLLIGIPGNLAVIFVYQFRMTEKTDGRYFILPLAWTDMAALLISVAATLTKNTRQVMFPGFGACKLLLYFSYVSTSISLYLLCVIAIQRYLKICRPFGRQMNLVWLRCSVCICILWSVIMFIPVPFYYGLVEIRNPNLGNITGYQCSNMPGSPTKLKLLKICQGLEVFATFCNVIVITILYILITNAIFKQTSKMKTVKTKKAKSDDEPADTFTRSEIHVVETRLETSPRVTRGRHILSSSSDPRKSAFRISFMFMTISIVGFLAYLPSWTLILIETNNPTFWKNLSTVSFHICLALRRMYMVNHLCNPFIYGVFDRAFREEVKKLFRKDVYELSLKTVLNQQCFSFLD